MNLVLDAEILSLLDAREALLLTTSLTDDQFNKAWQENSTEIANAVVAKYEVAKRIAAVLGGRK
jgi:hypothetical protein